MTPSLSMIIRTAVLFFLPLWSAPGQSVQSQMDRSADRQDQNRALIVAIEEDNTTRVRALLKQGADPNASEPLYIPLPGLELPRGLPEMDMRRPALLVAVNGAEPSRQLTNQNGRYLSHSRGLASPGSETLELPVVRELVVKGAHLDSVGYMGRTALMWAIRDEHGKIAGFLLAHGASAKIRDVNGDTVLTLAVGYLPRLVGTVIEKGADVNVRGYDGKTALMRAVEGQDTHTVKLLLAHNADPDIKDDKGQTAITLAADNPKMLALLKPRHRSSDNPNP